MKTNHQQHNDAGKPLREKYNASWKMYFKCTTWKITIFNNLKLIKIAMRKSQIYIVMGTTKLAKKI